MTAVTLLNPVQAHTALLTIYREQIKPLPGVYLIRCLANGRVYVGSSKNVKERLWRHFYLLRARRHENPKLQNSFDKHGESAFSVDVAEWVDIGCHLEAEQRWIDRLISGTELFNINPIAQRPPSFSELSEETREKKRAAHREASTGRVVSPEVIERIRRHRGAAHPNYGKSWTPERTEAARKAMQGAGNPSFGKKGPSATNWGIRRTEEARRNMSEASAWNGKTGALHPSSKSVQRLMRDGSIQTFGSIREAARQCGFGNSSISQWLRGLRKPADGSRWSFK